MTCGEFGVLGGGKLLDSKSLTIRGSNLNMSSCNAKSFALSFPK